MSNTNGFGKSKYSNNTGRNYFGLKKGHNVYRILPAMKSLAEEGKWFFYHGIHFGFVGTDSKATSGTRLRTFRCIKQENRRLGTVTQECPMCTKIEEQRTALQDLEANLRTKGKKDDEIATETAPLVAWLKQYNVDFKCYVNAMTPDNEFGSLKLNHKFNKKALDAKISDLLGMNIDPLDLDQGVWFDFVRTTNDGNDALEVLQESVQIEGKQFFAPKKAPLDEVLATRALNECDDLVDVGWELSFDQIDALAECDCEPESVDKIFAMNQRADRASNPAPTPPSPPANEPKTSAASSAGTSNLQDAEVQKRLADIKARAEAEKAAAAVVAKDTKPVNPNNMSDADFLKWASEQATKTA